MSERSGGRERSEQSGASERVSGVSERANGQASGPVLQSVQEASYYKLLCRILRPLGDSDKTTGQIVMKFGVNDHFIYYRKTIKALFENFVSDKRYS